MNDKIKALQLELEVIRSAIGIGNDQIKKSVEFRKMSMNARDRINKEIADEVKAHKVALAKTIVETETRKLWEVYGEKGDYEDHEIWTEAYFLTEKEAEAYAKMKNIEEGDSDGFGEKPEYRVANTDAIFGKGILL
jgi:acyl-CoA reductase-like NAD-dependent aldehyde dehydrogenase